MSTASWPACCTFTIGLDRKVNPSSVTLVPCTTSTRSSCSQVIDPLKFRFLLQEWEFRMSYGGKSPEQKVEIVRQMTAQAPTLYLGDGINDAPAMLNATAGVALGVNSDITSEAAGAVILQSSLASVDELIHIGSRMRRIALFSAVGGMTLSLAGMGAAAAGYLSPIQGALLQEAIDLLSILNSLRMILPTGPLSDFRLPSAVAVTGESHEAYSKLASVVPEQRRTL